MVPGHCGVAFNSLNKRKKMQDLIQASSLGITDTNTFISMLTSNTAKRSSMWQSLSTSFLCILRQAINVKFECRVKTSQQTNYRRDHSCDQFRPAFRTITCANVNLTRLNTLHNAKTCSVILILQWKFTNGFVHPPTQRHWGQSCWRLKEHDNPSG